jgi:hypothetical protein
MSIVGGLDIRRKQLTFDYLDQATGEVKAGRIAPADRRHLTVWLRRFEGVEQVTFAAEACTGWRYVVEGLQAAGVGAQLAEPADTAAARGRKKRAKTDRADSRHLRELLDGDRVPRCWIPPQQVLEHRALLELYHDLRREHTPGSSGSTRCASTRAPRTWAPARPAPRPRVGVRLKRPSRMSRTTAARTVREPSQDRMAGSSTGPLPARSSLLPNVTWSTSSCSTSVNCAPATRLGNHTGTIGATGSVA